MHQKDRKSGCVCWIKTPCVVGWCTIIAARGGSHSWAGGEMMWGGTSCELGVGGGGDTMVKRGDDDGPERQNDCRWGPRSVVIAACAGTCKSKWWNHLYGDVEHGSGGGKWCFFVEEKKEVSVDFIWLVMIDVVRWLEVHGGRGQVWIPEVEESAGWWKEEVLWWRCDVDDDGEAAGALLVLNKNKLALLAAASGFQVVPESKQRQIQVNRQKEGGGGCVILETRVSHVYFIKRGVGVWNEWRRTPLKHSMEEKKTVGEATCVLLQRIKK